MLLPSLLIAYANVARLDRRGVPPALIEESQDRWPDPVSRCGSGKGAAVVSAKEVLVLTGCQVGANLKVLCDLTGLSRFRGE